jgi:hypothetical protein
MKTAFYITVATASILLAVASCVPMGAHKASSYWIYITGDTGRTVQISYVAREMVKNTRGDMSVDGYVPEYVYGSKNVIFTEEVTLPFFKEEDWLSGDGRNPFLEIYSDNDSTTRAIILTDNLSVISNDSIECWTNVSRLLLWQSGICTVDCNPCEGITMDSVLLQLKANNYPCYAEFSSNSNHKILNLLDVRNWNRPR